MCGAIPLLSSEIYNLYKDLNVMKDIEIRRLRSGGSYYKYGRRKDPIKVLNGKFLNTKSVGKPRTR
jgi:hypothetical protein